MNSAEFISYYTTAFATNKSYWATIKTGKFSKAPEKDRAVVPNRRGLARLFLGALAGA